MPKGRWITQDDREVVVSLRREGLTHAQISQRLGISRETVGDVLRDAGFHGGQGHKKKVASISLEQLRLMYEKGASILALSKMAGIGVRATRLRLIDAGATLRIDRRGWKKRPA